ncbi:MAG: VTT domain-containing protein, partial [Myxococcota bacterium]
MLLAATALYATGWRAGEGIVDRALSPELRAQLDDLGAKGVIGLAALRWVPVAHFGLLSMSLGALRVPLSRFMLSTVIGQTPIVTMWVVLGDRVRMGLADANIRTLGLLFTAIITVLMVAVGMRLYARWRKMRIL